MVTSAVGRERKQGHPLQQAEAGRLQVHLPALSTAATVLSNQASVGPQKGSGNHGNTDRAPASGVQGGQAGKPRVWESCRPGCSMTTVLLLVGYLSTLSFLTYKNNGGGGGVGGAEGACLSHSSAIFIKKIPKAWDL